MDGQMVVVALLIAGAGLYLCRHTWRSWAGKTTGCGKGCACPDAPALIPPEDLTQRLRTPAG